MEFNDFCNEIRDNIGEYLLGYDFDNIQLQEVTHNNNTTHTGLLISRSEVNVAPTIYMEQYYKQYQDTGDMDAVIKEIAETYKASLESTNDLQTEIFNQKGKDTLRYIYDPAERQLQSQEDILHNGLHISIPGYIVGGKYEYEADGYEEEPDYNYESRQCVTYKEAERIKENMLDEGYTDIYIDDETISIHDFWESEKFIKGSEQHQERTNTEEALSIYKQFGRPGATIHEMVGTALQHIDTDDMLQYFKDKISGGENLIRDYIENQIVANEINKERSRNEIGRGER